MTPCGEESRWRPPISRFETARPLLSRGSLAFILEAWLSAARPPRDQGTVDATAGRKMWTGIDS